MFVALIIIFLIGYIIIALEHPLKIDKTATALLLGMLMWVIYAIFCTDIIPLQHPGAMDGYARSIGLGDAPLETKAMRYLLDIDIVHHLGDITQTLFFLIGAMTIVELVDVHGGFSVITGRITTKRKRLLLVVVSIVSFLLSSVLDNLTTTIVMLMLLRKLIADRYERWIFAGMVVVAANTGGAWSPIGDITTIMLWVKGNVTTSALISFVLLPSIVALLVPLLFVCPKLHGDVVAPELTADEEPHTNLNERINILVWGILGLLLVPVFKSITHLPPFIGILFVLGVLWLLTEIFYNKKNFKDKSRELRLGSVIKRVDMSTILFFFGILMAVGVLQSTGILGSAAQWLDEKVHNVYIINLILGILSSIVDNVPLVAAAMGMYPVEPATAVGYATNFMVDGTFWEFLSYCAGVGGSMLIIGSASGVIAMGIERIPFGWYLKRFTFIVLLGYLAGGLVYFLEVQFLKPLLM